MNQNNNDVFVVNKHILNQVYQLKSIYILKKTRCPFHKTKMQVIESWLFF